jgi:hypothetical protein
VSVAGATGAATPTGTITLSSGSYSAQQTLAPGANTLAAAYSGDAIYAAGSAMATITVTQATIEISAPATVSAGSNTTATAPLTAGTSYSGTMNLTRALTKSPTGAVGLPACDVNPASATLKASGSATSVLTLTTTRLRALLWQNRSGRICGNGRKRSSGRHVTVRYSDAAAALCRDAGLGLAGRWLLVAGCGGSGGSSPTNPETTSGTYTFTVTGTDSVNSSITTATTVNLAVQ